MPPKKTTVKRECDQVTSYHAALDSVNCPPGIWFDIQTLLLFTKSDFKTTIAPQTIFAMAALFSPKAVKCVASFDYDQPPALLHLAKRLPLAMLWLFVNCLIHDIANQSQPGSIVEDSINKSWRPIPSGRITPAKARTWLPCIIATSLVMSYLLDALSPTTLLNVLFWMYNDLDGASAHSWVRNSLNAAGFMCFGWGALSVISGGQSQLLPQAYSWLLLTGAIVLTTIHVQDLADIEGDRARDRLTFPITYGETMARWSIVVITLLWSVAQPLFWALQSTSWWLWLGPLSLGAVLAIVTMAQRGRECDKVAFQVWCLWLMVVYFTPVTVAVLS